MSNFLDDTGDNPFSATLAFRNQSQNQRSQQQSQQPLRTLSSKSTLPVLQKTNSLPPGSSISPNIRLHSPVPSRLKSPSLQSTNVTTPGKRLSALDMIKSTRLPQSTSSTSSNKLSRSDIIDLSSDDDEPSFEIPLGIQKPKSELPTPQPVSTATSTSTSTSTTTSTPAATPADPPSNLFNSLNKFSYNTNNSDSDSDDEIIITGINNNPSTQIKRDATHHQDDEIELARKRQQILDLKKREIEQNQLREQKRQQLIAEKVKLEESRLDKIRIDKLLENYRPLQKLPQKYQINFPQKQFFEIEQEPILPDSVSQIEIRQDALGQVPTALRALEFRQNNRLAMRSVVHRTNHFADLHSRMDVFLLKTAAMRNQVAGKAAKTAGNVKADIRYNQILRFIDSKIKSLSKLYGEVGMQVDTLRDMKKEIIIRARSCEALRKEVLFNGYAHKQLLQKDFLDTAKEVKLIVASVHEMYKLSSADGKSEDFKNDIRHFLTKPPPLPIINLPATMETPILLPKPEGVIDDEMIISDTPFVGSMSNVGMNRLNPYGSGDLNDQEGIKNLMESIKVTEIEEAGLATTPEDLCISLLKHQRIGLSWMLKIEEGKSRGGILADDMGLGKTVQAISLMVAHKALERKKGMNLIVGPVTLLHQWQQEIRMKIKTDNQMSTYLYHSTNKVRTFRELQKFDIVLVSYQTLSSEWKKHYAEELSRMKKSHEPIKRNVIVNRDYTSPFFADESLFYRIILDEAQYIKNKDSLMSKSVASLSSTYKWCLSGTPIQNRIEELFPIIRFLDIRPYSEWSKFNIEIVQSIKNRRVGGTQKIHALLSAILLRRTKDSEIDGKPILSLPEKHIIEEEVAMGEEEKEFYSRLEMHSANKASTLMNQRNNSKAYSSILTLLLRMRQMCDHEYLVRLGEDGDREARLERFTKGWEAIADYSQMTYDYILKQRESGFVCLHCSEELGDQQTLLLSKCGHSVCYDCHTEYFQEHVESETAAGVSARCTECGTINLNNMSVDLLLFESYVDGLTWPQVRKRFELDSKAGDKNWRLEAMRKFIEQDGKLFISAKVVKSLEIIDNVMTTKPGEKIIVFSQFLGFFDILAMKLRERKIKFMQYDGSLDMSTKNDIVNEFYKNADIKVLLLSLKAGNVGLTLTCANHVIITEPFWNPYVEKQAQDRVHRISQTKEVFIHRLLIKGTVEDRIMTLQKEKEELVESALDPSARSKIVKLSRRELGFLFGLNGLANLEND